MSIRVRLGTHLVRHYEALGDQWGLAFIVVAFSIIGGTFGALHCLAWNSIFPTQLEQTVWRGAALVVTLFPGLGFAAVGLAVSADADEPVKFGDWLLACVYSVARLCLLGLALAALRALPERAYETPSWTVYIPHIG